jgi:hypothetical protein
MRVENFDARGRLHDHEDGPAVREYDTDGALVGEASYRRGVERSRVLHPCVFWFFSQRFVFHADGKTVRRKETFDDQGRLHDPDERLPAVIEQRKDGTVLRFAFFQHGVMTLGFLLGRDGETVRRVEQPVSRAISRVAGGSVS